MSFKYINWYVCTYYIYTDEMYSPGEQKIVFSEKMFKFRQLYNKISET